MTGETSNNRIPAELHPMCDETSMIATAALEKGCNAILRMLRGRQTGLGIYAVPRTGKTHLIDYFIQLHPEFMGTQVPCFKFKMWSTMGAPPPTKASFYTELLRILGYPDYTAGNGIEKYAKVIDLMVSKARQLKESRALLFIDEAHRLRVAEYGFLIDIFNELRDHGIRLKTVLVGQPELYKKLNSLKKYPQIKQRFMPRWYAMHGICDPEELERILTALDEQTEFPRDSGTTYTAFFLPVAYAADFRFSSELGTIWDALQTAATKAHLSSPIEFTMQTVMDYLAELLQELGALDSADIKLDSTLADTLALEAVEGQCDDAEETSEIGGSAA